MRNDFGSGRNMETNIDEVDCLVAEVYENHIVFAAAIRAYGETTAECDLDLRTTAGRRTDRGNCGFAERAERFSSDASISPSHGKIGE